MIVHIRTGLADGFDRRTHLVAEVGCQDLDGRIRCLAAQSLDHLDELLRTAVRQIVAIDRGDDDMFQTQLRRCDSRMLRLQRIDHARHAGLDVTKCASACADIAQDHHRGVLLGPAFTDVRAGRFFANRIEVEVAHQLARFLEPLARGCLYADPVGLALAGRTVLRHRLRRGGEIVHAAHLVCSARSCQSCIETA